MCSPVCLHLGKVDISEALQSELINEDRPEVSNRHVLRGNSLKTGNLR